MTGVGRKKVLFFVVRLAVLLIGVTLLYYLWMVDSAIFERYLVVCAAVSAKVLNLLGEQVAAAGVVVRSEYFSVSLRKGCDAVQPTAFYAALVLASPVAVALRHRLLPVLIGCTVLLIINIIRVVSLYMIGRFYPSAFEFFHIEVWQAVFIFLPLAFWLIWLRGIRDRLPGGQVDASP